MVKPGSYIICKSTTSMYYNCVMKVVSIERDRYSMYYLVEDATRDASEWPGPLVINDYDDPQEIDPADSDFPKDLRDQPVYHCWYDYFSVGDLVLVSHPEYRPFRARVRRNTNNYAHEDCFVNVVCVDESADFRVGEKLHHFRFDFVKLLQKADEKFDPRIDQFMDKHDYVTGELIEGDKIKLLGETDELLGYISHVDDVNIKYCPHCGFAHFAAWMERAGGRLVCGRCIDSMYTDCDNCGELFLSELGTNYEESCYCPECARRLGISDNHLHKYWYKPNPIFHPAQAKDDTLFMGVELEIDYGDDRDACLESLHRISERGTLMYFKRDGSLGSSGIEIVTHPCTLDFHQKSFPWKQVMQIALDNGYKSHDAGTCGLHIHVNRTALGSTEDEQDNTASKIVAIFDKFWPQLVKFSRRKGASLSHYAYAPQAEISPEDCMEIAKMKSKKTCMDHYCSVNLSNENTVEFRIFRGTLKYETLMAALELVSNIVSFAKRFSLPQIQSCEWIDLLREQEYEELTHYVQARGLCNPPEDEDCEGVVGAREYLPF